MGALTLTGTVIVDSLLCRESVSGAGSVVQKSSWSDSLFVMSQ